MYSSCKTPHSHDFIGKPRLISSAEKLLEGFNVVYTCHAAFGGPPKRDTLFRHYPKLRMLFDGIPWNDKVYEELPGGITHYFHLRQVGSVSTTSQCVS